MTEQQRLEKLLTYLESDLENRALICDVMETLLASRDFDRLDAVYASAVESRLADTRMANIVGLSQIARGQFREAVSTLTAIKANNLDPVVDYNLAYAMTMLGEYGNALELLDDRLCDQVELAPPLRMRCLHHLGRFEELGQVADRYNENVQVLGVLAVALFDQGDEAAAFELARSAADTSEGSTLLGMVALVDGDQAAAASHLELALKMRPDSARARLGHGLLRLNQGDFSAAAAELDMAAVGFSTHAGSWLACGWAYLLAGDRDSARDRFRTAHELDRGFAEALGALAVVDAYEGLHAEATRRAETALRLDPECHAGLLAKALVASSMGDAAKAADLFNQMITRPLAENIPSIVDLIRHRESDGQSPAQSGRDIS